MAPRFSVVVPTHERRDIVLRTVATLAEQSYQDFEVIVVDDGSGDGTAAALRALQSPFELTVLEQENRGAGAARNAGAAKARGEILVFIDDDMEADPRMLSEHDRSQRDGAQLVIGHLPLHPRSPDNLLARGVATWAENRRRRLERSSELSPTELLTGQMSVRRELFERVGGFDSDITRDGRFGGEDVEFGYRVQRAGGKPVFNPHAVAYQYYDVDPMVFLRRTFEAARAHQELAFRHPERADELRGHLRFGSRRARWLFAPLVAAPSPLSWPLRAAVAALVRSGRDTLRLRHAFLLTRTLEHARGLRAAQRELETGQAAVLAYHAIADLKADPVLREYGVPPALFTAQLDALRARGWTFVDLDHLLAALAGERRLPPRALLLTFDDCYADLIEAAPLLAGRGSPAVAFAVADRVGAANDWDEARGAGTRSLLGADALRSLPDYGIEVGAHGRTHRRLTELEAERWTASCAAGPSGWRPSAYPGRGRSPTRTGQSLRPWRRPPNAPGTPWASRSARESFVATAIAGRSPGSRSSVATAHAGFASSSPRPAGRRPCVSAPCGPSEFASEAARRGGQAASRRAR